jgi:hypothetical protein
VDSSGEDDLRGMLDSGGVTVAIDVPEGGVSGELLFVSITNTTDGDVNLTVPCGLLFVPDDFVEPPGDPDGEDGTGPTSSSDQRMINLTPFDVDLDAGATTTITPYVMCIDSSSPAPESGAVYAVGGFADDDLLALAECVCDGDLLGDIDPMLGDMSLQMAMWAVADGEFPDIEGAMAEADGALGDLVGDEAGIDFDEIAELLEAQGIDPNLPGMEGFDFEAMLAQASAFLETFAADSAAWLERCDIDLAD